MRAIYTIIADIFLNVTVVLLCRVGDQAALQTYHGPFRQPACRVLEVTGPGLDSVAFLVEDGDGNVVWVHVGGEARSGDLGVSAGRVPGAERETIRLSARADNLILHVGVAETSSATWQFKQLAEDGLTLSVTELGTRSEACTHQLSLTSANRWIARVDLGQRNVPISN